MIDTRSSKDPLEPQASPKEKELNTSVEAEKWDRLIQEEDEGWLMLAVDTVEPWLDISEKMAKFLNYASMTVASMQKSMNTEEGKKKIQLYVERRVNPVVRLKGDIDALIAFKSSEILKELENKKRDEE